MLENTFPGNFHSALKKGFLYSPLAPSRNSFKNKQKDELVNQTSEWQLHLRFSTTQQIKLGFMDINSISKIWIAPVTWRNRVVHLFNGSLKIHQ